MSAIVECGGGAAKEEKTVTAGTGIIEVFPDTGKLLSKVVVNPTPSQSKTVTPSASQQTLLPDAGNLLSSVAVYGDSNLVAENIKSSVNIFGVDGTFDNSNGTYVWKKLTAQGGDFLDFVVSDSESAYPDGGPQGGYWYEKFNEKKIKVVSDSVNFNIEEVYTEFQKTVAHGLGRKPDYYGITSAIPGNSNRLRKVSISADDTNIIFDLYYSSSYRDATFEWFAMTVN